MHHKLKQEKNKSSKFTSRFLYPHYAVMRHAKLASDSKKLDEGSVTICVEVSKELAELVRGRKVRIYHSPLDRAVWTANVVRDTLLAQQIAVLCVEPMTWLNCGSGLLNNTNIEQVCADDPGFFTLFVTHLPEIEKFLGEHCNPANNTIISQGFLITGNR